MLDTSIFATEQQGKEFHSLDRLGQSQEYLKETLSIFPESVQQDIGTWLMFNPRAHHEKIAKYKRINFITLHEDNDRFSSDWLETELPVADEDKVNSIDSTENFNQARFYFVSESKLRRLFYPIRLITDYLTTDKDSVANLKNEIMVKLCERFSIIARREENWDGRESEKPSILALDNARTILEEFIDVIFLEGPGCDTPFTSSDQDGYITVAWYGEERKLHLKIEDDEAVYVKVWRQNGEIKMSLETLHRKDYLTIWEWFLYG